MGGSQKLGWHADDEVIFGEPANSTIPHNLDAGGLYRYNIPEGRCGVCLNARLSKGFWMETDWRGDPWFRDAPGTMEHRSQPLHLGHTHHWIQLKCEREGDVLVMNPPCQAVAKHCRRTLTGVRIRFKKGRGESLPPPLFLSCNNRDGGWRINVTFRRIAKHMKDCPMAPICYTCS